MRSPPLVSAKPRDASVDGSRGTKASRTAATIARPTPTHNRLASSVKSSARTEKRAAYFASTATIGCAIATPSTAPLPQRIRLSASSVRRSVPLLAPSAARTASSPSRRTLRARIRFATFEHGDDEHEARGREQDEQHGARPRGDLIAQRHRVDAEIGLDRVRLRIRLADAAVRRAQLGARRLDVGAWREPAEQLRHPMLAAGDHRRRQVMRAGDDVGDELGFSRIRHRRFEHADDHRRARAEADRLAEHRRVGR